MKTVLRFLVLCAGFSAAWAADAEHLRERDADFVAALKSEPASAIRYLRQHYAGDSEASQVVELLGAIGRPFVFTGATLDGGFLDSRTCAGRVILLDVWFRGCRGCETKAPELMRLAAKYRSAGLVVISLSIDSDSGRARDFVDRFDIPWPVLFDGQGVQGKLARDLLVSYAPRGVLIDRRGNLRMLECFGRKQSLEVLVETLLGEETSQSPQPTRVGLLKGWAK